MSFEYNIVDVTSWGLDDADPNAGIPHAKGKKLSKIKQRRGCDYRTALALYEGRAIAIVDPTIVVFRKSEGH